MLELIRKVGFVPQNCVWEITRACNLNCAHCGTSAGSKREDELGTDECIDIVQQLSALGTHLITLSGGEPTVRDDWPLIAKAASDAGMIVNMVTNGQSRRPQELAKNIMASGMSNVGISVDGLEPTHDRIRKEGSFLRTIETIQTLASSGIWVDVMLTVNKLNLHEIPAVFELAQKLGARGFRVQLGKPMGNQTFRDDFTLEPHHMLILLPMLIKLAKKRSLVVNIGDSIGYFCPEERIFRQRHSSQGCWTGCYAGVRAIGIQSDGSIKGCLSLQPRAGEEDRFIEGNVRDSSLRDIWVRPGAFAYNREFSMDHLSGACAACSFAEICRGGAKCVAHSFTGELGCDPICFHAAALARAGEKRQVWKKAASAAAAAMIVSLGFAGCSSATRINETDADIDADPDLARDADVVRDATPDVDEDASEDADAIEDADAVEDADALEDADVFEDADVTPDTDTDLSDPCHPYTEDQCEVFVCNDYADPSPCEPMVPAELYNQCCCIEFDCSSACPDCEYGAPWTERHEICCTGNDYGLPSPKSK